MVSLQILALALLAGSCYGRVSPRIVGGYATTIEEVPFIVQIEYSGILSDTWSQSCAGTLVSSIHVISAAYCFTGDSYDVSRRRVRAGATTRNTGGTVVPISSAVNHENYITVAGEGDISLVFLATFLNFDNTIAAASLVVQDYVMPDNIVVSYAGWGSNEVGGSPSDQLQVVNALTINRDICRENYAGLFIPATVSDTMICAGILGIGGADACRGDVGGPLYYENFLIGIISWGHGCGEADYPGVNTAISAYSDWIISMS